MDWHVDRPPNRQRYWHRSMMINAYSLSTTSAKMPWGSRAPVWRHFATLYFIFVADSAESELGVLDLIQVLWLWESTLLIEATVDATEMYQHFPSWSAAEGTFRYPCPGTLTLAEKSGAFLRNRCLFMSTVLVNNFCPFWSSYSYSYTAMLTSFWMQGPSILVSCNLLQCLFIHMLVVRLHNCIVSIYCIHHAM